MGSGSPGSDGFSSVTLQSGSTLFKRSGSLGSDRVLFSRHSPHVLPFLPESGPHGGARLCVHSGLREGGEGVSGVKGQPLRDVV